MAKSYTVSAFSGSLCLIERPCLGFAKMMSLVNIKPRFNWLLAALVVLAFVVHKKVEAQPAATIQEMPEVDRRVAYKMDVSLDPETKTVVGKQQITWRNPDAVPVDELQFHLYLNAFKNEASTFMKESGGSHRGFTAEAEDPWGGIDIDRMQIIPGVQADAMQFQGNLESIDLTDRIEFIHPDDDNYEDQTVISVRLPEAVPAGESITLEVDFTSKMPEIFARTGWERKANDSLFFMVAQWFPKLGVYEIPGQRYMPADAPKGKWSTHQFHANSEFYADFGTYDVTITTPDYYTVGASGVLVDEVIADGSKTVTYYAEDVHDFAWTASGDFLEYTDQWEHVNLRLLLQPEHRGQEGRHFEAVKAGLAYFDEWVGPYPYTTLTLVDGVGGSNGMEYPTLITCGTAYMLPEWVRVLEVVTIHEFGHQYFYGMLASNEAEEAWLDEGINSYLEMRIMDAVYGEGAVIDFPWMPVSDGAFQRLNYVANNPGSGPIFNKSWEYARDSDYGKASYSKPATVLTSLERLLGWHQMQEILQTYYQRWRFKHPTTRDFQAVVEDVSGQSMNWFFDQYIYGTAVVDYAVESIDVTPGEGAAGYMSEVSLKRLGDGFFPLEIQIVFADGTKETRLWDGKTIEKRYSFETASPVSEVYVDPENKAWLDIDRMNNRMRVDPEKGFARLQLANFTVWLQQVLSLAGGIF